MHPCQCRVDPAPGENRVQARETLPANIFASMARGRTTCCTLGSRMTSIRSSGPPWGRHGLTGITRVGGAACGESLSNSMYPVRGDERERGGGPAVVALMGAVALSGCSGPRASSIARRRQQPVHQPFLQREAGRYATGIADAFGARGRVSGRRHPHRSVDLGGGRQVRTAHRRRSALPTLVRSDRPRVPGAGRHHVHQSRRTRPRHTRADGRTRPDHVPLRYAVVREGPEPKTIATKFKRLSVAVPADQTHMQFVDVEEGLSFPLPAKSELGRMSSMSVSTKSATRTRSLPKREEAGTAAAIAVRVALAAADRDDRALEVPQVGHDRAAPARVSCSPSCALAWLPPTNPIAVMPAAVAAVTPAGESSITMQSEA